MHESATGTSSETAHQPASRIVVAGGSGFLGRALCAALVAKGHAVIVLSRNPRTQVPGTSTVSWDGYSTTGSWTDCLAGATAVVNLCGESISGPRWTSARKKLLTESRTQPARVLVSALEDLFANRDPMDRPLLVQASGIGYVGTGEASTDETSPPGTDFLAELALAWEDATKAYTGSLAILRFGVVLGEGGALPAMLLPFRLFAGGPIGTGTQWLSWIHVDDAIAVITTTIGQRLTGIINVTAPNPVRNAEFARIAGRVLKRPALLPLPAFVLQLALGEQADLVCKGQHAMPSRLLAAGFSFAYPVLEPALQALCRRDQADIQEPKR